ncbi:WD40 repeat-like protein [Xylaria curta]|nr:WD40 repeat-like protein [Xylaria curta]
MVKLREIARTAAFAWSPNAARPILVTGTRAGAVDADFSDETKLELWDLDLDNQDQGLELQPIASFVTDSRFYDLAWGQPSEDHPKGIIAGALENGSLDLWDVEKLISGGSDSESDGDSDDGSDALSKALIKRTTKHTGPIKSLQFNPLRPQILATAGAKGEIFIYDVNDPESAFRLGTAAARSDDLECVAWNIKVSHILATGGTGGFVTVWDLKTKKASLTLNNNRKPVSAIAWDPNNSTKLLTATPDDSTPVILLWDLRNSNAPERTLQGHEQGVLSVSWCQQDGDILISSGKDNKTLIWNPQTGERYGEFPEVTNWTFLTRFHPRNPNLSATAAFDGKITIQTLQNTNPSAVQNTTQSHLDGEDFFTQAQTQPQGAAFSLAKAPSWLEKPVGVSFGFGGKLVTFSQNPFQAGQKRSSKIQISQFSVDSDITSATEKFEESLKSGDLAAICESHKEQAHSEEEKADWRVIETLLSDNPRKGIVDYLGFNEKDVTNGAGADEDEKKKETEPEKPASKVKGHKKRISTFFADGPDADEEDFLANLSATKGAKTDNPFQLFGEGDSAVEKQITKALMLGNFEKATEICLDDSRMADAFIIANCGGKDLVDRVQSAYLSQKTGMPSYLRLLGSVIVKNLWDVVYNADLTDWKETMVTLCTFADPTEFSDLCEALGDRILESGSRKDASFCYLVGSKLEKVVDIWVAELAEAEKAGLSEGSDSTFSIHARALQQFIEKVTVFRHVAKFQDSEADLTSGWTLALLYDKYVEYADIVAAHGQLEVAQKYLDLLPTKYPAADIARSRVQLATKKVPIQPTSRQPAQHPVAPGRVASRAQHPGYPVQSTPINPSNPYGPSTAQIPGPNTYAPPAGVTPVPPASNPYAPTGTNPYAPQGIQAPLGQTSQMPPPVSVYHAPPPSSFGPPRSSTPSSRPPPPKNADVGNWNDVPVVTRPPPRRNTPSTQPITSPFPNQANQPAPPPQSPYGIQRTTGTPPPPPKGPPTARVMSPLGGPPQAGQLPPPPRPGSSASSAYAPPTAMPASGTGPGLPPPPAAGNFVPRTASPYNPPPAAGPPSNRYAPAPAPQQSSQPPPHPGMAPPPSANRVPPNPYAPPPQSNPSQSQYAPSPYAAPPVQQGPPPSSGGPPTGPPMGPPTGPPAPPAAQAAPPPKPRHPPGDRSHIPPSAQQLVDVFSRDMQRVATKAPASFAPQVKDTQKRLGLLFDHLNNGELVKPDTIEQLTKLALALEGKDYPEAQRLQVEIQRDKTEECGNWMVGVKRLVQMSKVTN